MTKLRYIPLQRQDEPTASREIFCTHFVIGKKYNLEVANPVGANGVYLPSTSIFAGKHINKVNPEIIELLQQNGKLLFHEKYEHSYPHCWRHKTPLIFRATPQWFISMEKNSLKRFHSNPKVICK